MIRCFIIILETTALIYLLFEDEKFHRFLQRLLNTIPSSTELKFWILKGISIGAVFVTFLLGIVLIGVFLYKRSLMEKWEEEFIEAKQTEIKEIEKLRQEAQNKIQEAQKREQELRQQITYYQHLSHQLRQKEIELEIEFQQKRESYLQELSGLQRKNRELQARIKRLKEQLKSCREKLKKRGLA